VLESGFFIKAKDQGFIRRIQIQSDNIFKLFKEMFVFAQFERLNQMGLRLKRCQMR